MPNNCLKLIFSEKIALDNINREKAQNIKYEEVVFGLENLISKLQSEILVLKKKKQDKSSKDDSAETKEIYIIDPCKAVISINDELAVYRNAYSKLLSHYQNIHNCINEYEATIQDLKCENARLEREVRDKEKIIILNTAPNSKLVQSNNLLIKLKTDMDFREEEVNLRLLTHNDNNEVSKSKPSLLKKKFLPCNKLRKSVDDDSKSSSIPRVELQKSHKEKCDKALKESKPLSATAAYSLDNLDKLDISEWRDVVRIVGFNEDEYNNIFMTSTMKNCKLLEAIDLLNMILVERNKQINLLDIENSKLNNENKVLFNENQELSKTFALLNQEHSNLLIKHKELQSKHDISCLETRKNSHFDSNSNLYDNQTSATIKHEKNLRSTANTPSSNFVKSRANQKVANQLNTLRQIEKNENSHGIFDYYKNVQIPDDSSSTEFEEEINQEHNYVDTPSNKRILISSPIEENRLRLLSFHSAHDAKKRNRTLNINIPEHKPKPQHVSKEITKRSLKTTSDLNFVYGYDANVNMNNRPSSTKTGVFERLSMSGNMKYEPKATSSSNTEFIKIEDQKEDFFEISNNIRAIKEIECINSLDKTHVEVQNVSVLCDKNKSNNLVNDGNELVSDGNDCMDGSEKLTNLINLLDDERIGQPENTDLVQFRLNTCNSKRFKTDFEAYNPNSNNFKEQSMSIEASSLRLN